MAKNGAVARIVNEGMTHLQAGRMREADACFREALTQDGTDARAWHGLGIVALQMGHFAPALSLLDRALAADPQFAAAHVNRGNALNALRDHQGAVEAYRQALIISPGLPGALINMANAQHASGRLDEAIATLEAAHTAQPESAEILNNLGNLLKDRGETAAAIDCYRQALERLPTLQQAFSNTLAALKVDDTITPAQMLARHREWSCWFETVSASAPILTNTPEPTRRLRLGYVSPDCHTALPAFIDPIIAAHDRERFEVFCYFNNPQPPEKRAALKIVETTRSMRGMDDAAVAARIAEDRIDVLIDIAGHTGHNRLGVFARRPAPVQLTWLDYLGTTGLDAMDYRITDARADPPGSEAFHSEQLLRMPHTQWCWRPPMDAPPVAPPPMARNGYITFGSFNHAQKLSDATLALWARVLAALPDARLRVVGVAEGRARERVRAVLGDAAARADFLPRLSLDDYRRAYGEVDVALDPRPFSGATTTLDALWQGVPVLTLPGANSCSRSAASILGELGLDDWVAADEDDFIARALRLAKEANFAALRDTLRDRVAGSTLVDTMRFTRDLEALLRDAWATWCARRASADADTDTVLLSARAASDRGDADEAMALLKPLMALRPQWDPLKREYGRAALAWSRRHPEALPAWEIHTPRPAPRTRVSAIVCSIRPDYFAQVSRELEKQFSAHALEIIGIHDAVSLCEGYNRGAAKSTGDILVFCHDDIAFAQEDFGARVVGHLQDYDLIGVIGADRIVNGNWGYAGPPHLHGQIIHRPPDGAGHLYLAAGFHADPAENIQALDGVFMAARRHVWEALRFDEANFDAFHLYDVDFSYRAHLAGYRCAVPLDLLLIHFSTGKYDHRWQKYNRRFLAKFPALDNVPSMRRYASLHIKLQTLEQVGRVHAALLHHRFGP